MGENIYMLPSDMNLKIRSRTVRYNNKILVPDGKFSLGKNVEVNLTAPVMKSHRYSKTNSLEPTTITTTQGLGSQTPLVKPFLVVHAPTISHEDEKFALVLSLTGILTTWFMFQ